MQDIADHYTDDKNVAVVAIQTAFEGFGTNNATALQDTAEKYSLAIPLGHNGWPDKPSPLLYAYRARGTPWFVIIDRDGYIRQSGFYQPSAKSIQLIEELQGK